MRLYSLITTLTIDTTSLFPSFPLSSTGSRMVELKRSSWNAQTFISSLYQVRFAPFL
jgi:hypothetical protein